MAVQISAFFDTLRMPLKNVRWSWGAVDAHILLLRGWQDDLNWTQRTIELLRGTHELKSSSAGRAERVGHLLTMWAGQGAAGYVVVAEAVNPAARPRVIKSFREDVVFPVKQLHAGNNDIISASLTDPIPVATLRQHAASFRTAPAAGAFPTSQL